MIVPYAEDFTEFQAQPDMKLQLKGDWNSYGRLPYRLEIKI